MRVLFVNAPWVGKAVYPPLGLAYLAAMLDKEGIENEILDSEALQLNLEDVKSAVKEKDPDLIGMTATTPSFEAVMRCAKAIKEVIDRPIVLGGIHITSMPEDTMKRRIVDIGVIGEGEITFVELIRALEKNKPLKNIKGLIYWDKGKLVKTPRRELIQDLDSVPFPARHKIPMGKYIGNPGLPKVGQTATIMTTRGCPFQCTYCSSRTIWGMTIRKRSAKNVLGEVDQLVRDFGIRSLMIKDDTFTIDKERVKEICKGLKKHGLIWSCSSRVNTVNEELIRTMADSGCKLIEFGFESGSQRVLDEVMKKGTTLEQARNAARWCKKYGIGMNGFFMLGNPTETEGEMRMTVEFAKELNPDSAQWAVTMPYPGSAMYDMFKDKIGKVEDWEAFLHVNPMYPGAHIPKMLLTDVDPEVLHKYIKEMTRHFTLRPKRIIRNLKKIRSPRELVRQVRAGMKLILPG